MKKCKKCSEEMYDTQVRCVYCMAYEVMPKHCDQMWLPFPQPFWPPTCPDCKLELEDVSYGLYCHGCWKTYLGLPGNRFVVKEEKK